MKLCSIASGSSGNCIYIGSDEHSILVDAGISAKRIEQGLNSFDMTAKDLDGIFVTHEHSDHIKGIGVMARRYHVPIYGTPGTISEIKQMSNLGKIEEDLFHTVAADTVLEMGDLSIEPFTISHDAAEPVGYKIENGDKKAAVATDMGVYNQYIVDKLQNLDALLLEANHDINMLQVGSYPYYLKRRILGERGHLSNESAGRLLCELLHDNMKAIFLGHLSHENNYEKLAFETVCSEVTMGDNPYKSSDFRIAVAHRDMVSECVII